MALIHRRNWMQSAAGTVATLSAASYLKAAGANERVRVASIGLGGRGRGIVPDWRALANTELVAVCDVDQNNIAETLKIDSGLKSFTDLRQVLDDKSIDAVCIATPDHWHAPAALLALEAGKHVYVEKPCAHNLREAKALVDATRKHKLHVQHGTQARSSDFVNYGIQKLREGIIGDVLVAKAWNVQFRGNIGHAQPSPPPPTVDYDTWLGPAPEVPYQGNRFHYTWHWWYDFGTGDMGNDGTHDLDIARWGLGVDTHPSRVTSIGGKYFYDDDQQFPDTHTVIFEYPGDGTVGKRRQLVFEMRLWSRVSPYNCDQGCEFYGTKGAMLLSKTGKVQIFDNEKKKLPLDGWPEITHSYYSYPKHMANFIAAIREGTPLKAEIEVGYLSSALCHLGNISARVGRVINFDPTKLDVSGDEEANRLIGREYRTTHWGTPKGLV